MPLSFPPFLLLDPRLPAVESWTRKIRSPKFYAFRMGENLMRAVIDVESLLREGRTRMDYYINKRSQ